MERKEIFSKLNEIFIDVLDLDECELTEETSANEFSESHPADCGYREVLRHQVHLLGDYEMEERRRDGELHGGEA